MRLHSMAVKVMGVAALTLFLAASPLWAALTIKGPTKPVNANGSTVTLTVKFANDAGPTETLAAAVTSDPDGIISNLKGDGSTVKISKKGKGMGKISFKVSKNESSLTRNATVTVNEVPFTFNQAGQPCKVTIAPPKASFAYAGGAGSFNVTAPAGCQWSATETLDWITVGTADGTANGTVTYAVDDNTGKNRSGKILVAGMDPVKQIPTAKKTYTVAQKGGNTVDGHTPVVAIYASAIMMNLPDTERAELNGTKNPLHLHTILLPYNCSVSFVIVNEGPVGTILKYSIDDIGALGGFLDYTNGVGSLKSGEYSTITVTVDPNFTRTGLGGLGEGYGSTLVLTINTPGASNSIKNVVSVHVLDFAIEVQKLIGIWKGTWSGLSYGPNKTTPVSGTWTLNLLTIDWLDGSVTATLSWSGNDAWWDFAINDTEAKNSMPHYLNVNRSFEFDHLISSINGPRPCFDGVSVHLPHSKHFGYFEEIGYVPDPSNPDYHFEFSPDLKSIVVGGSSSWSTRWWDPIVKGHYGYSWGFLSGSKIN